MFFAIKSTVHVHDSRARPSRPLQPADTSWIISYHIIAAAELEQNDIQQIILDVCMQKEQSLDGAELLVSSLLLCNFAFSTDYMRQSRVRCRSSSSHPNTGYVS